MKELSIIKNFQENFRVNGMFTEHLSKIVWHDWFCKDTALLNRGKKLASFVAGLQESAHVNIEKDYVFFKNNCPMVGGLYDSFSICDGKTGDVKWWVAYKCPHSIPHNDGNVATWSVVNCMKDAGTDYYFKSAKDALRFISES